MTLQYTEACTCPDECRRHSRAESFGQMVAGLVERMPPPDVVQAQTVENLANELCVGAEPDRAVSTQDELLTALDELLDNTLHDDRCYIGENDTTCVCIIGAIRSVLPPCGAVYRPAHPQRGDRIVTCHRNAHPASPDRHVF